MITTTLDPRMLSKHAMERCKQRRLSLFQVGLAIDFGRRIFGTGVEYCFLGRRDMPKWLPPHQAEKFDGTVVILGADGGIVTTYRNPNALRSIRKLENLPHAPPRRLCA